LRHIDALIEAILKNTVTTQSDIATVKVKRDSESSGGSRLFDDDLTARVVDPIALGKLRGTRAPSRSKKSRPDESRPTDGNPTMADPKDGEAEQAKRGNVVVHIERDRNR
jgi:hypothetical protein